MTSAFRLANRTRAKGWADTPAPSLAQALDELCAAPSVPWDAGERFFHTDLPGLDVVTLRAERARIRSRLLFARDGERLPWHHERLATIESELRRRGISA